MAKLNIKFTINTYYVVLLKSHWNVHTTIVFTITDSVTTVECTQDVYNFSVYPQYIVPLFPYIAPLFRLLILPN